MRDLLVTAIILGTIPFIFRRAQIGVMVWVWISVMNPHRLSYGFAYDFNFAAVIAGVTLLSALMSKDLKRPPMYAVTVILLVFTAWTGVTTIFAIFPDESFEFFKTMLKTQTMVILIPMLFHKKEDLRALIWVIVLSIAYFGTKGGLFILLTGGADRVYGPPGSYIEDNNALAAIVVVTIPLMRYLQLTSPDRWMRWGILAMMLLSAVAVIGSYSRGAMLGVIAMAAVLWWKGRQKLTFLVVAILLATLAIPFMPDTWFQRMDTINTYQEDTSATARLNSWTTMTNLANDRPMVGGGFALGTFEIYRRYSPDLTTAQTNAVAHSIYFQALGEHGYVGLALYLMLLFAFWRTAGKIVRATRNRTDLAWARDLSSMMQVAIAGFAVVGAFLSLVNFDMPYYLIGIIVATRAVVDRELRTQTSAPASANRSGRYAEVAPTQSAKRAVAE